MKNGSLKLASWNVNGLRACMGKGFPLFLEEESPDVLCLQETKMQREQADFQFPGYHEYWNSATTRKGYSGTAIFSKREPPLCHLRHRPGGVRRGGPCHRRGV